MTRHEAEMVRATPVKDRTALQSRLSGLQTMVRDRDRQMEQLSSEVERLSRENRALQAEAGRREAAAAGHQQEVGRLVKQRDALEEEVARLTGLVGKGAYNEQTTKVLHCGIPPLAQQRIDALEAQLEAARQPPSAPDKENVPVALAALQSEVAAQKARLEEKEKLHQKLVQEFQKQTVQYRDNVYKLTGWKIHKTQDQGLYRLTSCFLPHEDQFLLFMPDRPSRDARSPSGGPGGGLKLLDSLLLKTLGDLSERTIGREHGIPMFLAEAQLKLQKRK